MSSASVGADAKNHLFRVPASGGAATQWYSASGPNQNAVLGANVFWIDANSGPATDTQILKAPADGSGSVTAIYAGSSSGQQIVDGSGLAADDSFLYAADEYAGTVWRLNPDGSGMTQIGAARYSAGFGPEHLNTLATYQGTLYVADYGQDAYSIPPQVLSLSTNGGSFIPLASGAPFGHLLAIAVGDGKIFLTDATATNTIWQLPVGGGTPTVYVSGAPFNRLLGLAWADGSLYVADNGAGAIYRITSTNSTLLAPAILSFNPGSGVVGTAVTVTGSNFVDVTSVTFNGTPASFTTNSDTELSATVPQAAATGPIAVTTTAGTGTSTNDFVVELPPLPVIVSFDPGSGAAGSVVTVTGSNFVDVTSVTFNGTSALFTMNSETELTVTVPESATTGPIGVTAAGGTATSSGNFVVLFPPVITGFTPIIGSTGTTVTVFGRNFTGATSVNFRGVNADFGSVTSTQLTATVPDGTGTGPITVINPDGSGASTNSFVLHTPDSTVIGPFYPPPLGCALSESGSTGDGSIGRSSGKTWYFSNVMLANPAVTFWGATNGGVRLSFLSPVYPNTYAPSEIMTYFSDLSSLSNGVLVWTGQTFLPDNGAPVYTRFTVRIMDMAGNPLPLADAASARLTGQVGGALIVRPGMPYQANLKFEASYSSGGGFQPALDFYDSQSNYGGTAYSSFTGGFYYENTTPVFLNTLVNTVANKGVSPVGPLYFQSTDNELGPNFLTLWATSTNQALVPDGGIQLARTDYYTYRMLIFPAAGEAGLTLVTVYASDGSATNSQSFLLQINNPPTISDITDKITNKDAVSGPHAFTIGDVETSPDLLQLQKSSSNPTLLPTTNIVFGGSGGDRTVTLIPATGQIGSSTVTITVSDGVGSASDSFVFTVNDPPLLAQNNPLNLLQGQTATIDNALLEASDTESGPARLTYTVGFDGNGGPPREGTLTLNGTNLAIGGTFTQDDINNGRLRYTHNGACSTNDDFQFNVNDGDGGVTPTGDYVVYSFRITITQSNHPPVLADGSGNVGVGATWSGTFAGVDEDCFPQTLTFRILTNGTLGTATLVDPNTGEFTYAANPGETGIDTVAFQVNDGTQDAVAPGIFSFVISNQPPSVADAHVSTLENRPVTALVTVQDPDQPAQTFTCRIETPPAKGSVAFTNTPLTFVYTPDPSAIGDDSFTVVANDGSLDSAPATVRIFIRPNMDAGDVVFSDKALKRVTLVDSAGAYAVLATNGFLSSPRGIAFATNLDVLVMDTDSGLVRIDRLTGEQSLVSARMNFADDALGGPLEIAVERSGTILVADGANGVVRVNPETGVVTPFVSGGDLVFPKGVTVDPANGDIYVADLAALFGQASRIVRIDPVTAAQNVVATGGNLVLPIGLAVGNNGLIYASDPATYAGGPFDRLTSINPRDGTQTLLVTNGLAIPLCIATASGGRLLVPDNEGTNIVSVNRDTGELSPFAPDVPMGSPCGIAVVHRVSFGTPDLTLQGWFTAPVLGEPGETYPVQASSNLVNWDLINEMAVPGSGIIMFTDTNSPAFQQRFYRLLVP